MGEGVTGSSSERVETPEIIEARENFCFGCGPANPQSLHLEFLIGKDAAGGITARATVNLTRMHQGPPGYIHGGIVATLLDEAMAKLNKPVGVVGMTRSLMVDYLKPSPLNVPLQLVGKHVEKHGNKVLHSAQLMLDDGTVLAKGEGFFIAMPPDLVEQERKRLESLGG